MDEFDIKQDPVAHQLLDPAVAASLISDCAAGVYGWGHFGIPCRTFTVILRLQRRVLRLRSAPRGRRGLTGIDAQQVGADNRLIRTSCTAAMGIFDAGGEFTLENVADRGDPSIPECYWPAVASMCPLALHPEIVALTAYCGLEQIHIPLGSFAAPAEQPAPAKWVTIFATAGAAAVLRPLRGRAAPAETGPAAIGRNAAGESRAALTAAYPSAFNAWLAAIAATFAGDGSKPTEAAPPGSQIGCGNALHPAVRAAIEQARAAHPRFADFRRLDALPRHARRLLAYPTSHLEPPEFGEALPDSEWTAPPSGVDDERPSTFAAGVPRPLRAHHDIPGLPPGRVSYEMIFRRIPEEGDARVGYLAICSWTDAAFAAAPLLAAGDSCTGPPPVEVPLHLKEPWARLVLLDTRDPTDVVRAHRSTRDTIFAGPRQVDRAALRNMGLTTGWYDIDPDILGQAAEGGVESRSQCPRHTLLAWHHRGIQENFEVAHEISVHEFGDQWLVGPFRLPPFEPARCIPDNVIMQNRSKVDEDGHLVPFLKPRVTTNESYGGEDAVNAGVPRTEFTTSLPSHQTHCRSAAITDSAFRAAGETGEQYCTDVSSAYSFMLTQRADWWQQLRFWIIRMPDGRVLVGYFIRSRMLFGGKWGPNRFQRIMRMKVAHTRQRQRAFDAAHAYPEAAAAVVRERAALQRTGGLPPGPEQLDLASLQAFIDDEAGSAGADRVPFPPSLAHIDVALITQHTAASGARPAAADSRVMVHCCMAIDDIQTLGLESALEKVQCGDGVVVLGLRCDVRDDKSDCPPSKATPLCAEMEAVRDSVTGGNTATRKLVERVVGKLGNLSQICPSLLLDLHAGYAIASAHSKGVDGHRSRTRTVRVRRDSPIGGRFLTLLDNGLAAIRAGANVPLIFAPAFPSPDDPLTLVVASDASGHDGVGGFAFIAGRPREVWVVHAAWPRAIADALAFSAMRPSERTLAGRQPACSMPAGELFGGVAVAGTVRRAGVHFTHAVCVLDCKPAAIALSASRSRSHIMRLLTAAARADAGQWLGAHVRRESNTDCDMLSHPDLAPVVVEAARAAGLTVHDLGDFHPDCWATLESAIRSAFEAA